MRSQYLYVIGFTGNVVKVGRTVDMVTRAKAHRLWARRAGLRMIEMDFERRNESVIADERRLIAFCAARWETVPGHREFFSGADFEELWEYFSTVEHVPAGPGSTPA